MVGGDSSKPLYALDTNACCMYVVILYASVCLRIGT